MITAVIYLAAVPRYLSANRCSYKPALNAEMKKETRTFLLTINSGSSSLKFSLFDAVTLELEIYGVVCELRPGDHHFTVRDNKGKVIINHAVKSLKITNAEKEIIDFLQNNRQKYPVTAIGHRVVQGGAAHKEPELITAGLLEELNKLIYLAPNHLPDEINLIKTFGEAFPGIIQVACFDTFFHRNLPDYARTYALPEEYRKNGLVRYGFHGLSYESIVERLVAKHTGLKKKKIIIAHLGSGASIAAVKDGVCIDTTMGISPIGGLIMSTRCGDLDPGAILFLLRQHKLNVTQLDEILSRSSGLKAIAGTGDMVTLSQKAPDCPEAQLAIAMFCYHVQKFIGGMTAALGGLDLLVFTGGIGENSPLIRKKICEGLEFSGIKLKNSYNEDNRQVISKKHNRVKVLVVPADEATMIAKHTCQIVNKQHQNQST